VTAYDSSKKLNYTVDGDIVAYRAASVTDGKGYLVTCTNGSHTNTERFKYKADADRWCQEAEDEGWTTKVEIDYNPEPWSHCKQIIDKTMMSLETAMKLKSNGNVGWCKVFITEGPSFREQEFPSYKSNRDSMHRPHHLAASRQYLKDKYGAIGGGGVYEADDLIGIHAGPNVCSCSIDKDMLQIPGLHYNWTKDDFTEISEEEGRRNLYRQILMGDATDGIPGLKGIGPKTADKLLGPAHSEFLMYLIVLKTYLEKVPYLDGETTEEHEQRIVLMVRSHARLLYLLRSEEDTGWQAPEEKSYE